jgi:hypothetical protein
MSTEDKCPICGGFRGLPRILHDTEPPHECDNEFHKKVGPVLVPEAEPEKPEQKPQEESQTTPIRRPLCPYCDGDGKVRGAMTTIGQIEVMVVCCQKCGKVLFGFQVLQLQMVPPQTMN